MWPRNCYKCMPILFGLSKRPEITKSSTPSMDLPLNLNNNYSPRMTILKITILN